VSSAYSCRSSPQDHR